MKIGFEADNYNDVICFNISKVPEQERDLFLLNLLWAVNVEKKENLNKVVTVKKTNFLADE